MRDADPARRRGADAVAGAIGHVGTQEFVALANQQVASITAVCEGFGISRKTGYKWLARALLGDPNAGRSGASAAGPSPSQTLPAMEDRILAVRSAHPSWGGRKLHHWLRASGIAECPRPVPSPRSCVEVDWGSPTPPPRDFIRFLARPRRMRCGRWTSWGTGHCGSGRVHPSRLPDDHSRLALGLSARANQQQATVKAQLTAVFRRYGLPRAILTDNGVPWATGPRVHRCR